MDKFFIEHSELSSIKTNAVGEFFLPTGLTKDGVINTIAAGNIYQEEVIQEFKIWATRGSTVIDLGANVGQMSVALSKNVGKDGTVISVEADPYMAYVLSKNVLLNKSYNTRVISAAAWSVSGEYLPYPDPDLIRFDSLGSYGITPDSTTSRKVPSLALDDLQLHNVSLIKMDIQGSELQALHGLKNTIKKFSPAIIIEYEQLFDEDFNSTWSDYLAMFKKLDYKVLKSLGDSNFVLIKKGGAI